MSDSDQSSNAITEEQRKQQLTNLNVDESVTALDSDGDDPNVNGVTNKNRNPVKESPVEGQTSHAQSNDEKLINGESLNSDHLQSKDVPNQVLEDVVDDISKGIVEDFSKNIATYVTEVCRFDEKYEKEQINDSSENQDKESASSGSEVTEGSSEHITNLQNDSKDESSAQTSETLTQEVGEKETTPLNPDNVKENDVKDKCLKEDKKESGVKKEEDTDGYLDLLGNGLLRRKVVEGDDIDDIKPFHGEIVTINTSGKLEDGTIIDTFTESTFAVGEGDVIQAWDLGVMTTKVGQTIELITDSKYAYGELGRKPDIPSNATITYTIKLLKKEAAPDLNKLDIDQRLSMSEQKRERGNALFARNDFPGAIHSYNKAIKILESGSLQGSPEKLQSLADCRLKCCNNMAACQLKVEAYDAAIISCLSVLDLQPENVKALFRLGKAHTAKGATKNGILYLQRALKLEPDSKVIKQEIRKLLQKINKETEIEKNMYKKMMGTKIAPVETSSQTQSKSWKWAFAGGAVAALVATGMAAYRYGNH